MNDELLLRFGKTIQTLDDFPGWIDATPFIESIVSQHGYKRIADIGGGANPIISCDFARKNGIDYCLMDISRDELDKAPAHYTNKICIDLTAPTATFLRAIDKEEFDLVFSHMFLEHVRTPVQAHKNIHSLLKPGGIAVHFYPTPYNLPLALNRVLPERLTTAMIKISQPERDLEGHLGKFRAYYKMCGNPGKALHQKFENMGYTVLAHTGFVGHRYYNRIPILRDIEFALRPLLARFSIGMTSAQLLILKKSQQSPQ